MSLIVCSGPGKGEHKAYRCPCCGSESDSLESFAMSTCWPCSSGDNIECERCVEYGVWVDRFSSKRGKGHRFMHWVNGNVAVTACGFRIEGDDIGQGILVRRRCLRCWPEEGS